MNFEEGGSIDADRGAQNIPTRENQAAIWQCIQPCGRCKKRWKTF